MSRFLPARPLWEPQPFEAFFPPRPKLPRSSSKIDLLFFDAGGGHRASATALQSVFENQRRPWRIRMVNIRDVLEPIDVIRRIARVRIEDCYNRIMLKHGMTLGTGPLLRATQMLIRKMHRQETTLLARFWEEEPPDLVVSLIPNLNRAVFDGLRAADEALDRDPTPMVTILTDLADYPPHFWIERQEQYLICATDFAIRQAMEMGHRREHIFRTSGMIVRPEFYRPIEIDREHERARLGLRPDLTTGIVMFGGYGSRQMLTIAKRVSAAGLKTQLIFLCGHNQTLREQLSAMELPFPFHVEGFTRDIPHYMRMADYFIGKPGPGSISEAIVMGLPVIVQRNSWTMVQERFNADWIVQNELGIVLHSFAEIATGILPMLDPDRMAAFCRSVGALNNRAVFEIPDILAMLLERHACVTRQSPLAMSWLDHSRMNPNGAASRWAAIH